MKKHMHLLLLALASFTLAACGANEGASGVTGAAGTSSTGNAGSTGAAGTAAAACQVNIVPIAPNSFEGLTAGPSASVRVRGAITGLVAPLYDWQWSVTLADGSPVDVTTVGSDPSLVEFPLATAGTYTIAADLTGAPPCKGVRTITVSRPGARVATFRLRVTPSSTELVPAQELLRQVIGGAPSGGNVLALEPGIFVAVDVRRQSSGLVLPSYVRLTEATSGAVFELRTTTAGNNALRVASGRYGMIVVPDGDVAPLTFPPRSPADITAVSLDDGAMVTGTVVDAADQPLPGARVVLRGGDLVSTTGTTDAKGAFRLRARAGKFAVTVVSSLAGGGALESKLATETGIVLDGATTPPPLGIKVQTGSLAAATVKLSAKNGASVTPETRVTLAAMEPLTGVATIAVGAAAPRAMTSNVHLTLHPQADGTLSTGPLPRGRYLMTVFPSLASASDGVTTATLDLRAGDLGPLSLPLAQKVMLKGRLGPANATSGVRLVALDEGGLPVVAEADAGDGGLFQIAVSPMRRYALRALPRPDQPLARVSFPVVPVADIDLVVQDRNMPPALLYAGRVVDPSLQGVGTALVQAFCEAAAPGCADPTTPVAETVTRTDGTFQLMLPDPDGSP